MKTYAPRPRDIERRWYVIDANGAVLGRLASEVAKILRGKHKPIFAPHADTGDHVVVVNARGVVLSGNKLQGKLYHRHSGYPGGLRTVNYERLLSQRPVLVVEKAVRGMLPKNRLGRKMFTKLAVYEGPEHPHQAQQPVPLGLGEVPRWEGLPAPPEPKVAPEPPAAPARGRRTRATPGSRAAGTGRGGAAKGKKSSAAKRPARPSRARTGAGAEAGSRARSTAGTARGKAAPKSGASPRAASRTKSGAEKKTATRSRTKKDEEES